MEVGKEENQRKDSAQKRAMKSSFIHTVSSNYQCIYSIPSGVSIVLKNNRVHTYIINHYACIINVWGYTEIFPRPFKQAHSPKVALPCRYYTNFRVVCVSFSRCLFERSVFC